MPYNEECGSLYSRLAELYQLIRARGFSPGPDRWLAAHDLLLQLHADNNSPQNPEELLSLLAPLFCSSPEDQQTFYELFRAWAAGDSEALEHANTIRVDETLKPLPKKPGIKKRAFQAAQFLLVFLLAAILYVEFKPEEDDYFNIGPDEPTIEENLPSSTDSPREEDIEIPTGEEDYPEGSQDNNIDIEIEDDQAQVELEVYPIPPRSPIPPIILSPNRQTLISSSFWFMLVGIPACILFFLRTISSTRRKKVLKREKSYGNNRLVYLQLRTGKSMPFALNNFSRKLRRSVLAPTRFLDMNKTIQATINKAGLFVPVLQQRNHAPEYIVLLDRSHNASQLSALGESLVQRMYHEHLDTHHYYYRKDPRWCYKKHGEEYVAVNLETLVSQHPYARLIVIGDAEALFSDLTDKIHPWINAFKHWNNKIWLSNKAQPWGYRESQLAESGFALAPLESEGLASVADWLHNLHQEQVAGKAAPWFGGFQDHGFPPLLERPAEWLKKKPPKNTLQKNRLKEMLVQLTDYLGEDGMRLLIASAAYPEINGNLTIALEQKLFPMAKPSERERRLIRLSNLPWCQQGLMPDYLREELLYRMKAEDFSELGKIYNELFLIENGRSSDIALAIPDPSKKRRLLPDKNKADVPSHDQLLVKVLRGKRSRLDFVLPENITRQLSRRYAKSKFSLASRSLAALAAILVVICWPTMESTLHRWQLKSMLTENTGLVVMIASNKKTDNLAVSLAQSLVNYEYDPLIVDTAENQNDLPYQIYTTLSQYNTARTVQKLVSYLRYDDKPAPIVILKDDDPMLESLGLADTRHQVRIDLWHDIESGATFRDEFNTVLSHGNTGEKISGLNNPGWYGFASSAETDSDLELALKCAPNFKRIMVPGGKSFNEVCDSINLQCRLVCDSEGKRQACDKAMHSQQAGQNRIAWCEPKNDIKLAQRPLNKKGIVKLMSESGRYEIGTIQESRNAREEGSPGTRYLAMYNSNSSMLYALESKPPARWSWSLRPDGTLCRRPLKARSEYCNKIIPQDNQHYLATDPESGLINRTFRMSDSMLEIPMEMTMGKSVVPGGRLDELTHVRINGKSIGRAIVAGSEVSIGMNYSLNNTKSCPSCIVQLRIGFVEVDKVACVYNGIPGVFGKSPTKGSGSVKLKAPDKPGRYLISYDRTMEYSCIRKRPKAPKDDNHILGFIDVIAASRSTQKTRKR